MRERQNRKQFQWMIVLLISIGLTSVASADRIGKIKVRKVSEHKREVAVVVIATINANVSEIDLFQKCIARVDWPLPRKDDPNHIFRAFRWTPGELAILQSCNTNSCKYNFTRPRVKRLMAAPSVEKKKQVYFQLLRESAVKAVKKRKEHRIITNDVRGEPCTDHGAFHWLVDGWLKPYSQLSWRKLAGSKHMRPTTSIFHVYSWKVGQTRCVGRTMLFSDHYYHDHLELFQITPKSTKQLEVRFHVRSRFDILDSWWKQRTYKGKIRKVTSRVTERFLRQWVHRCLK